MSFKHEYLKSAFSVDNLIFGFDDKKLKILLIKRSAEPHIGEWALPGDLVHPDENLRDAPLRILKEITGLDNVYLEQVHTFGKVDRHPLGRIITVAYLSLIKISSAKVKADSIASEIKWIDVDEVGSLAFDHNELFNYSINRLRLNLRYRPIGMELLPQEFTLSQLQMLYEEILQRKLDKRNFRKKILSLDLLKTTGIFQKGVAHRPAELFSFNAQSYQHYWEEGFTLEL